MATGMPGTFQGMFAIENIILRFIKMKSDFYVNTAHWQRERIRRFATVDKSVQKVPG